MSDIISLNSEVSIWFFFIGWIFLLRFTIFSLIRSIFSSKFLKVETCLLIQISGSGESEKWKSLSHVRLFATPGTIQSMELFRPEYWSGVAFPFSRGSSPPQGSNPGFLHCMPIHYQLSHRGSPVWFILGSILIDFFSPALGVAFSCFFACLIIFDYVSDMCMLHCRDFQYFREVFILLWQAVKLLTCSFGPIGGLYFVRVSLFLVLSLVQRQGPYCRGHSWC